MPVHTRRPYHRSENLVWLVASLDWVVMTQPGGSGGAGDASAANQVTEIARLTSIVTSTASIDTKLTSQATAAKQDTGNTSVGSIDTKTPALGQALAAASVPIVLTAIQQTALTPPAAITGFALEAGHLAAIDTSTAKIPALGQALAANSVPVILPSATITTLTPPAAIAGFALEAGHLATIDTSTAKIPSQGQALAAASVPVVLTAIQIAAITPDVALSTRLKPADTLTGVTTVGAVTTITNPVSTKTDLTPSAPTVATVGITSASAVGAQATRKGLSLRNLSTSGQRISLGFGQTAVLDSGNTLYPQDVYYMGEYDFDLGAVNAIASAVGASLAIQENLA